MKILKNGIGGVSFSLEKTREMINGDTRYESVAATKVEEQLRFIKNRIEDGQKIWKQILDKYKNVGNYPRFLLDEFHSPSLLEPHVTNVLIEHWLYNVPLPLKEDMEDVISLSSVRLTKKLEELLRYNGHSKFE